MTALTDIATIVTFFALTIALWQSREAWRQTKALTDIHGSLSTRYIGPYPDFLSTIVQYLENTSVSLTVVVDCPCYAGFSFPDEALRCTQAIEKLITKPNVHLRFITGSEKIRRSSSEQFTKIKSTDWNDWRNTPKNKENLLRLFGKNVDLSTITYPDFENRTESLDKDTLDRFNKAKNTARGKVQILEHTKPLSINFWIVDGKKAVFSLLSYSNDAIEYGFETSDARLIAALEGMAEDFISSAYSAGL